MRGFIAQRPLHRRVGGREMKNIGNNLLKNFEWLSPLKSFKVVHGSNARYALILFASGIISGQAFGADVKPELFHFDCERVDARLKQPLEVDGGFVLIEANGGKVRCKGGAEIVGGFFVRSKLSQANSVLKIDAGNAKSEAVGNKGSEQGASYSEPARDQSNFVGSKLHDVLVIAAGGFGGIAIGLSIAWAMLCRITKTPNV